MANKTSRLCVVGLVLAAAGPAFGAQVLHTFTTSDHEIKMAVEFSAKYSGKRLVLHDSAGKEICVAADGISGQCIDRFVGAIALVKYSVRLRAGGTPRSAVIREYVTTIAQSPGLAERPPFAKAQPVVDGSVSDLQVFGYDESSLSQAERSQAGGESRRTVFRSYRQELYLNDESKPFAVIEWKHSYDRIAIVRIDAPFEYR